MGKILTALALSKRGVNLENILCSLCEDVQECVDHVLVSCQYARTVWDWTFKWCGISPSILLSVSDVLDLAIKWFDCPIRRKLLLGIFG